MSSNKRLEMWEQKWSTNKTMWHLAELNFGLKNHGARLLPGPRLRVFVPLCGKTVDLRWLYDEGHSVVGVEAVEKGIVEFFTVQNLSYTAVDLGWAKVYKTEDERLQIFCCDMMEVNVEALGQFNAVWDRGSLVAIYEEDREKYAKIIKALLLPDFRYLINAVQYVPNVKFSGPPRNIPMTLVEELFGDLCHVEAVETVHMTAETDEKLQRWGIDTVAEVCLLLTPKN